MMISLFRKSIIIFLVLLTLINITFGKITDEEKKHKEPINPNATIEARQLLWFMYYISGKKILSGVHNYLGRMSQATDSLYELTGRYPALWGGDFGFADSTHDIDNIAYRHLLVPEIQKQFEKGSLITMTYHQANPAIGEPCQFQGGDISSLTDEQWEELLTEGTPLYEKWRIQMDLFAEHLKQVQELKIPILFRPYHEMNGKWFWWGGRPGEKGFIALWKQLYKYYTEHHKLNNLIWVWSPDKPWHGLKEFYPGNEWVDIVGCDIYPVKDTNVVFRQEWYEELLEIAQDMPIGIGECSKIPSPELMREQNRWAWFLGWVDLTFIANTKEELINIFNDERVISIKPKEVHNP